MVRLKEKKPLIIRRHNTISIPYGAIKSFTKGRSKKSIENFNSLWCD